MIELAHTVADSTSRSTAENGRDSSSGGVRLYEQYQRAVHNL